MAETAWVDGFLTRLELIKDAIDVEIGGEKLSVIISDDIKQFFKSNKLLLVRLGRETFKDFLSFIHQKRDEEAFMLLLSRMNAQEIIDRMNQNADDLKKYNDDMDAFIKAFKQMLINTVIRVASKGLIGLII